MFLKVDFNSFLKHQKWSFMTLFFYFSFQIKNQKGYFFFLVHLLSSNHLNYYYLLNLIKRLLHPNYLHLFLFLFLFTYQYIFFPIFTYHLILIGPYLIFLWILLNLNSLIHQNLINFKEFKIQLLYNSFPIIIINYYPYLSLKHHPIFVMIPSFLINQVLLILSIQHNIKVSLKSSFNKIIINLINKVF